MIRFVDLREADIGKRFAFWDTVRERFLTLTDEQAWDDAQAFRRDWESVPLDAAELERYLRLMPEWARGEA